MRYRHANWLVQLLRVALVFLVLGGSTVQAQVERPTTVSAIVRAQGAPPTPELISPANESILTSGVVEFVWQGVDHTSPIDRYELSLNGQIKFANIHVSNQTTDDYTLTVDSENVFRLRLKPDKWLPDGIYTWKIRAIDTNDRGTDSTTWSFTIDSTPPPLLLIEVDGETTAISATDPSTIPVDPIEVSTRTPVIKGKTEALSEVELIVRSASGAVLATYQTTADSEGRFQFTLAALPLDEAVSLTFTAIDLAENSTVLDGVRLLFQRRVIVITLPPIIPVNLTIEIRYPFLLPRIPLPEFPSLPEPLKPFFPTISEDQLVYERPVQPVGWLWGGMILAVVWYVTAYFLLVGNPWRTYGLFWMIFVRFWFYWWRRWSTWEVREARGQRPLPLAAHSLHWLNAQKNLHTRFAITGPEGQWTTPPVNDTTLFQFSLLTLRAVFPSTSVRRVPTWGGPDAGSTPSTPPAPLHLLTEGFLLEKTTPQTGTTSPNTEALVVPANSTATVIAWSDLASLWSWRAVVYLPRLGLFVGILCALWLSYFVPAASSLGALLFLLWLAARDTMLKLPQRCTVYVQSPDTH